MTSHEQPSLIKVITVDFIHSAKIPLILLVMILISAMLVVTTTYRTRSLTAERERLILERDALDIEWRNLILEENALGAHNRVERIASEKLKMQQVNPLQENIVIKKYF
ncbi:cell division protein FtsL [Candidatus Fukatsuia symbiotica]|uniref:Cell division protein FtsL n=1 Tax=Candidatus Fukatsuia symbiotica TaxID=1878942 RepID=A0A2U8I6H0_9GAMM|nr:cell division protein FtsL [Candidatus Fukatsuia symbiotica]AWK14659.1 cell division protein FtsL [Candidatus Fukatsuia symbiotica]MEA9444974.1 cell division protein FtsL [Candidatus Fukatsuia symbiotica]